MKISNSILNILLVFSLLVSLAGFQVIAQEQTTNEYSVEIDFLQTIGVIDSELTGIIQSSTNMTKAQYTKFIVKMLNMDEGLSADNESIFQDVSSSNKYFKFINLAYQSKMISGGGNGIFDPDKKITYAEAVKMAVSAIGYDAKAAYVGGYPTGYLKIANELNVLKGINLNQDVSNLGLTKLIYNAMQAPYAKQKNVSNSEVSYETDENVTILTEMFKIYKNSGIVYDNGITKLDGVTSNSDNQISFKNLESNSVYTYDTSLSKESTKLGYYYTYYFKQENATANKNLIFVYEDQKNTVLTIDSSDLIGYRSGVYTYEDQNGNSKTAKIANANIIIYNETAYMPVLESEFVPAYGSVELIDYNNDKVYDVIKVKDILTICAESFGLNNYYLKDKYNLNSLGLEENVSDYKIYKDGQEITFEELEKWNILSVQINKNIPKFITIQVSDDYVEGVVEQVVDFEEVILNGKSYEFSQNIKNSTVYRDTIGKLDYDSSYVFYLDIYGKIAGIESNIFAQDEYIWLRGAATESSVDDSLNLKAYTINRKFEVLKCASKVNFNGVATSNEAILNGLTLNGAIKNQLLRIDRNSAGLINKIETASYSTEFGLDSFFYSDSVSSISYKASHKIFNGLFLGNDQTVVFTVPTDATMIDDVTMYDCMMITELMETAYPFVTPYDIDENGIASALVVPSGVTPTGIEDHEIKSCIVDRIVLAIYSEGETREKIYYYQDNILKSSFVSKLFKGKALNTGDVFRPLFDNITGEISYYVHGFDFSDQKNVLPESSSSSQSVASATNYNAHVNRFVFGEVVSRAGSTIRVKVERGTYDGTIFKPDSRVLHYFSLSRSSITVYKSYGAGNHKIYKGTQDDIIDALSAGTNGTACKVFMRQRYGTVFETYIYIQE